MKVIVALRGLRPPRHNAKFAESPTPEQKDAARR